MKECEIGHTTSVASKNLVSLLSFKVLVLSASATFVIKLYSPCRTRIIRCKVRISSVAIELRFRLLQPFAMSRQSSFILSAFSLQM